MKGDDYSGPRKKKKNSLQLLRIGFYKTTLKGVHCECFTTDERSEKVADFKGTRQNEHATGVIRKQHI
jgi:hypothetical protein